MSRSSTLILLGIFTIITPFSGLPMAFRSLLLFIFGVCTLSVGLSMRANKE
jgi:hypothetical protein